MKLRNHTVAAVVAAFVLVKHQLSIFIGPGKRSPNLRLSDGVVSM